MTSPKPDDLQPAPDYPDKITFFASAGLTDEDRAKIVALVTNGEHLAAIKWVRECFNLALADGKAVVEKGLISVLTSDIAEEPLGSRGCG